jgi:IS30 family transposase
VVDRVARGFSPEQEDTVWDLHRGGESSREIGRVLGMNSMAIRRFLGRCGGIRPVSRRRRAGHLTEAEREDISRGIAVGSSARTIADHLGRSPSTPTARLTCARSDRSQLHCTSYRCCGQSW